VLLRPETMVVKLANHLHPQILFNILQSMGFEMSIIFTFILFGLDRCIIGHITPYNQTAYQYGLIIAKENVNQ